MRFAIASFLLAAAASVSQSFLVNISLVKRIKKRGYFANVLESRLPEKSRCLWEDPFVCSTALAIPRYHVFRVLALSQVGIPSAYVFFEKQPRAL